MTWFFIAILAYLIHAINSIIGKWFVIQPISSPLVYSFYVGIFSIFALVLIPFGLIFPAPIQLFTDFLNGAILFFALFAFFAALKKGEASRIVPFVGALTAIFTFTLSYLFLNEKLNFIQVLSFLLLVIGSFLISSEPAEKINGARKKFKKHFFENLGLAVLASFLFSVFYILAKFIYFHQPFISGFVWSRLGSFLTALFLIIFLKEKKTILNAPKILGKKIKALFLVNQVLAGAAFFLLNYAISLGSATMINALTGVQYAFVFGIVILLSKFSPRILEEKMSRLIIIQKTLAILIISAGLTLLALF